MLVLRSLAFNIVFYVNLIVQMIVWTPYYFLSPRHRAWFVPKFWSGTSLWLMEKIAGTKSEITGFENLPRVRSSWRRSTSPSGTRSPSSRYLATRSTY